jgi:hypothetical protein
MKNIIKRIFEKEVVRMWTGLNLSSRKRTVVDLRIPQGTTFLQQPNNHQLFKEITPLTDSVIYTTHWLTKYVGGAEPFLKTRQFFRCSKTSQYFMELEGSLQCSQEPSKGPYADEDQSSPYHPILSLLRSILILSFRLRLVLPNGFFLVAFPPKPYMNSFSPHACYMSCPPHPPLIILNYAE